MRCAQSVPRTTQTSKPINKIRLVDQRCLQRLVDAELLGERYYPHPTPHAEAVILNHGLVIDGQDELHGRSEGEELLVQKPECERNLVGN